MRRVLTLAAVLCLTTPAPGYTQPTAGGNRVVLQRLAQVVQRRLGLSDEQAARLRATTTRFAAQRQELMAREREARRALRLSAESADTVDQQAIARRLDELVQLQERRVQILGEEQRELARFLTPLQRAQYLALQERAFRAAQQQRQQRLPGRPGLGPPGRVPPP